MATRTADPIIAAVCSHSGQVLVSFDKDFRAIAKRLEITQGTYRQVLHRIHMRCPEPNSATRLAEAIALIENEWLLVTPTTPMVIEVRDKSIATLR